MTRAEYNTERGPSWFDLRVMLCDMQKRYPYLFRLGMGVTKSRRTQEYVLLVYVSVESQDDKGAVRFVRGASKEFPNNEHRTMPGTLMGLLWYLDEALQTPPENVTQERLPF